MTDVGASRREDRDALLARLEVVEDQPLNERASAYQQVHDALQAELEGGEPRA